MCNYEWLLQSLNVSEETKPVEPNKAMPVSESLLYKTFHVGYRSFDQVKNIFYTFVIVSLKPHIFTLM